MAGVSTTTVNGVQHAFLLSHGTSTMTDLGTLGGAFSTASAVNNRGDVVGSSTTTSGEDAPLHAFLLSHGTSTMTDLGTLGGTLSDANDINDRGDVVGVAATTNNAADHAFLISHGTHTMTDLNTLIPAGSGITLVNATGISDDGQIAAYGSTTPGGEAHAFLLTPG